MRTTREWKPSRGAGGVFVRATFLDAPRLFYEPINATTHR